MVRNMLLEFNSKSTCYCYYANEAFLLISFDNSKISILVSFIKQSQLQSCSGKSSGQV